MHAAYVRVVVNLEVVCKNLKQDVARLNMNHWRRVIMQGRAGGRTPGQPLPLHGEHFEFAQCKSLQVGNVHTAVTEQMLLNTFSQHGSFIEVQLIKDKATGEGTGYAFVDFPEHAVAEAALSTLNGRLLSGQVAPLFLSIPRS